jgi:hypothetical protein
MKYNRIDIKWRRLLSITFHINIYSTGTILEKDVYFLSLMDRHTSRLIFCKRIKYTLYDHLSPVVEFSHGAFFLLELLKVKFRRFFKLQKGHLKTI